MIDRRAFGIGLGLGALAMAAPEIPSTALAADLDILERAVRTLHPGLYRYATPADVDGRFKVLRAELAGDMSLGRTYLALTRFTAGIRCGHTYVNPVNQKKAVASALFGSKTGIPALFVWRDGRMVVTRSLDTRLPPGGEIVAVNAVASEVLLARMMPLSRADGSVDAKCVANLELSGEDRIAAFDTYLPMIAPGDEGAVRLSVRLPGASGGVMIELPAIAPLDRKTLFATEVAKGDPPWSLDVADGVAVLRMRTWALFDKAPKWPAWLDNAFDRLTGEKATGLVIDLRGNEGGADVGIAILARLVGSEQSLPAYRRYVRYRQAPADLAPYLDTWDRSFLDWGEAATGPEADGFYRLNRFDDDTTGVDVVRPTGRRFTGKVTVLTEPSNSSATFQFALAMRRLGLGKLVGRATGGNLRGINGGAFFFLRLPGSGLEIDLPLIAYRPEAPQPDAGLEPDVFVVNTAADFAAGYDRELERARALVT